MRGLLDLFGAYERTVIPTRTKAALSVKRGRGEWVSGRRRSAIDSRTSG